MLLKLRFYIMTMRRLINFVNSPAIPGRHMMGWMEYLKMAIATCGGNKFIYMKDQDFRLSASFVHCSSQINNHHSHFPSPPPPPLAHTT